MNEDEKEKALKDEETFFFWMKEEGLDDGMCDRKQIKNGRCHAESLK